MTRPQTLPPTSKKLPHGDSGERTYFNQFLQTHMAGFPIGVDLLNGCHFGMFMFAESPFLKSRLTRLVTAFVVHQGLPLMRNNFSRPCSSILNSDAIGGEQSGKADPVAGSRYFVARRTREPSPMWFLFPAQSRGKASTTARSQAELGTAKKGPTCLGRGWALAGSVLRPR